MRRPMIAAALLLFALPMATALAQKRMVIYRCTDAHGALMVQNDTPCPKGSHQQKQVIDVPPALPAYAPRAERMPHIVAAEEARTEAAIERALPDPVPAAERTPPPALYQCMTWDQNSYLSEEATPQEHCAPLQTVALDGNPLNSTGNACEMVQDQCAPVAEDALCSIWKRRVDEAEFRWKFAAAGDGDPLRLEYEKLAATLSNSSCGK